MLVRPGAPTHAFDMEQRLVELPFTAGAGSLTATVPPNGNIAPPGFYMLFILNSAGVPSVARFVQLMPGVNQAPVITSGSSTTFTVGAAGSFTVTATGVPTPSLSESGALPSGVTFVSNGNGTATLSGTPASGTAGAYAITITASNGVTPAATQSFTLTVTSGGGGGGSNFAYVTGSVTGIVNSGGHYGRHARGRPASSPRGGASVGLCRDVGISHGHGGDERPEQRHLDADRDGENRSRNSQWVSRADVLRAGGGERGDDGHLDARQCGGVSRV